MCDLLEEPLIPGFPSCHITTSVFRITLILEDFLMKASYLTSKPCILELYNTIRDSIDLVQCIQFSRLYSPCTSISNIPAHISMLHHNDCMYLAHWCMYVGPEFQPRFERNKIRIMLFDMVSPLRSFASGFVKRQLEVQVKQVMEAVEGADGVECLSHERFERVEKAFQQVIHQIKHLSKGIKVFSIFFVKNGCVNAF